MRRKIPKKDKLAFLLNVYFAMHNLYGKFKYSYYKEPVHKPFLPHWY